MVLVTRQPAPLPRDRRVEWAKIRRQAMVHLVIAPRLMDKLAAHAVARGTTMGDEIVRRLEQSFAERAEPKTWR